MSTPWTPRRWFHVALGAVFLPVLSLPFVWGVWLRARRRTLDPDARRWTRGLLVLAVADTAIAGLFVALLALTRPPPLREPASAPGEDRVVIGVTPDRVQPGPGVRLGEVAPGGPAAAAGLAPGDVVMRVAGRDVASPEALRTAIGAQRPGIPVALEVRRAASTSVVQVTPRRASELRPVRPGLLDPDPRVTCAPLPASRGLLPLLAILAAMALVGARVGRHAPPGGAGGVWWTALAVLAGAAASYAVPAAACAVLGGHTVAGALASVWGSSAAIAATALVGRRFVPARPAPAAASPWGRVTALGAWYLVTGLVRLMVPVAALALLFGGAAAPSSIEAVAHTARGAQGPGLLLLAVPVVLFGPLGEELAFRGLFQPAVAGWLRPAAAVTLTTLVFAALHWDHGVALPFVAWIGAVLGWARLASGGLRAPVALHALVNAATYALLALRG